MKKLRSLAAAFMIAFAIAAAVSPSAALAAVKPAQPAAISFVKWNNTDFTSYTYKFKLTQHVDGMQTAYVTSTGITYKTYEPSKGISAGWWKKVVTSSPRDRIIMVYVRAYNYNAKRNKIYGAWSKSCGIVPWPKTVRISFYNRSKRQIKVKWSSINWNDGYNVMLTTTPSGKWYLAKANVTGTSAVIKKYRGHSFKKYQNYYVRVLTRNVVDGVDYFSPAPKKGYYQNGFQIY